jgi:hypothetical protein
MTMAHCILLLGGCGFSQAILSMACAEVLSPELCKNELAEARLELLRLHREVASLKAACSSSSEGVTGARAALRGADSGVGTGSSGPGIEPDHAPADMIATGLLEARAAPIPSDTYGPDASAPAGARILLRQPHGRALLQDTNIERHCSKRDLLGVINAGSDRDKAQQVVMGLMVTNTPCAMCIVMCATRIKFDAVLCMHACLTQNENRCDDETGLERIAKLIPEANLLDRASILSLLVPVEADCR